MLVVKSAQQNHTASEEILDLLNDFRLMVNDCIRIALKPENERKITSMRKLSLACYHQLDQYNIYSQYRLTAISKAAGILRNYRRMLKSDPEIKKPYAKKLFLTDCYGFKIQGKRLRLTLRAHEYVYIDLTPHTLEALSGHTPRAVTLTPETLTITYSKIVAPIEPVGAIGIDRNLDNVTTADTNGKITVHDISKATRIKRKTTETKSHFTRNDVRIRRKIYRKYGAIRRHRVQTLLHITSKDIVRQAKQRRLAIIMEDLTGIRKLYKRGNWQGSKHRGKMNSWSYYELQRQIQYKAKWEGVRVIYVLAWGTSSRCSICGSQTYPKERGSRTLQCTGCGLTIDRDVNAAKNILAKGIECGGLRFKPNGPPNEAMVQEPTQTEAKTLTPTVVILKVNGGKLRQGGHQ